MHQSHTSQAADHRGEISQVHEVVGANGCGARRSRLCAQARNPHGVVGKFYREAWCKTTQQTEHGPHRGEPAQRPSVFGYDRSMAETVATLGATSLQNGAAGTGGHTVAKAVLTALFAIVWLKGALHGASSWARAPTKMRADRTSKDHRLERHGAPLQHRECKQSVGFFHYPQILLRSSLPRFPRGGVSTPCGYCCGGRGQLCQITKHCGMPHHNC